MRKIKKWYGRFRSLSKISGEINLFISLLSPWLDIAYVVGLVSQFMHSLHESHMEAIYRILCYLKFTLGKWILFQKIGNMELETYSDAD